MPKVVWLRWIYTVLFYLGLPIICLRLFIKGRNLSAYRKRIFERFGFLDIPKTVHDCIWIHAVSVGEAVAAKPLVAALQKRYPTVPICMTTTTPTGSERVNALFKEVFHVYLPYDLPDAVSRFLNRLKPRLGILIETELWPNLLNACQKRHIPILLVNARLSEQSFRAYATIASLTRTMLTQLQGIGVQNESYRVRFEALGAVASRMCITGNLKFDLCIDSYLREEARSNRWIWVAASTHAGEEKMVLQAFREIQKNISNSLLILCPRHPERFDSVFADLIKSDFKTYRRSVTLQLLPDTQIYFVDTMGELMTFYAMAHVVFMGGSLVPTGGHNMLEPAALGVPILSGPYVHHFTEIVTLLTAKKALKLVANPAELAKQVIALFQNPAEINAMGLAGKTVIAENRGATDRTLKLIQPFL